MITERLMMLGSWTIVLSDAALKDEISYFDHVVVLPGDLRHPTLYDDASILSLARYVGIVRGKRVSASAGADETLELRGHGPAGWLGDEEEKGELLEVARVYAADTFVDILTSATTPFGILRADSGGPTAILAGTISAVAGTYTGTHHYQNQRTALRYICDVFGAEYRVNPDFTIDAGLDSDLFVTTPTAILARKITDGRDPSIEAIPIATVDVDVDVNEYTTRTVLLAEGSGSLLKFGEADAPSVPYTDPQGNDVVRTRIVNESETNEANADARAELALAAFAGTRKALTVSTREFDVEGTFEVGDTVYLWDPTDAELVDVANEVRYRGETLNPTTIRILGSTWPVTAGMAVYIRHGDGTYTDVTDSVVFESGDVSLEVGAVPRSATTGLDPHIVRGKINTETGGAADDVGGSPDTTPPSTPKSATVAGSPLAIQVVHDLGKASGGTFNLETDLNHLKIYVGTTSGFTPGESNRVGEIPADAGNLSLGITVVGTFEVLDTTERFVKVTAVDRAGNESTPSSAASVTAELVDTAHITDAAITTAKIGNLSVSRAKIKLLAVSSAQIDDLAVTSAKIGALQVTAAKIANATITNAQIGSLNADKITAGTITARKFQTASSGNRIQIDPSVAVLDIDWYEGSTLVTTMFYTPSLDKFTIHATNNRVLLLRGLNVTINAQPGQSVSIEGAGVEMIKASHVVSGIDEVRIQPAYTHTGSDDSLGITSTGLLRRITSARKDKQRITYNVIDRLAGVDLAPTKYYRKDAAEPQHGLDPADRTKQRGRWFYGPIADDLADQLPELGTYTPDGEISNYHEPGYDAVVAAKLIVAARELDELRSRVAELERVR